MLVAFMASLCTGCHPMPDLSGKDSYEGLPVYQYDVENESITIDGVLYKEEGDISPAAVNFDDPIGFIWYSPHYEVQSGVGYSLYGLKDVQNKEYLYASSPYYRIEAENSYIDMYYVMVLKRVD